MRRGRGSWLRRVWLALVRMPGRRGWFWPLAAINLAGFGFGVWWYWGQIASTPWYLLPLVPDSPLSTLLFGVLLLFLRQGRQPPVLAGVAYVNMIKYGLWTPFIIGGGVCLTGRVAFDDVHLTLSHLGMAAEAVVYARYFPVGWRYLLIGAACNLINDGADYFGGLNPNLPHPALDWPACVAAFALSCAAPLLIALAQRYGAARGALGAAGRGALDGAGGAAAGGRGFVARTAATLQPAGKRRAPGRAGRARRG